jgi:hypothetical protein
VEAFDQQIERMRRIFRGQETYGTGGTPAQQAEQFRMTEMWPEIVRRARQNTTAKNPFPDGQVPRIDYLISLSGFTPVTTILAYEVLRPRRVLVITSEKAERGVSTIARAIVGEGKLGPDDFTHRPCNPTEALSIYEIVRQGLGSFPSETGPPAAMMDITGGKKVMSATAALAAYRLDLPLCYVDGDYDNDIRQSVPGTEYLLVLPRPTTLFGDRHE